MIETRTPKKTIIKTVVTLIVSFAVFLAVICIKANSSRIFSSSVETAREAEKSVVSIETLQHTNQQLISTLDEMMKIQTEGAQKRKEAEAELGRIEGELKQKLLELRG